MGYIQEETIAAFSAGLVPELERNEIAGHLRALNSFPGSRPPTPLTLWDGEDTRQI